MYALLQAGYHNEITLNLALGKNDVSGVRRPTLQVSVSMLIKSEKMVPKQSRNTGVRASVAGRHAKQAGFFYESKPENIQKTLTPDMFEAKPSENMSSEDAMKIMASSIDDDDVLVGYQVELISKTSGQSKGLWVIYGTKKYRWKNVEYHLKNKEGLERWDCVEKKDSRGVVKSQGKPIILKRKVSDF